MATTGRRPSDPPGKQAADPAGLLPRSVVGTLAPLRSTPFPALRERGDPADRAGWARLYGRDGSHGSEGDEQKEIVKCDPNHADSKQRFNHRDARLRAPIPGARSLK